MTTSKPARYYLLALAALLLSSTSAPSSEPKVWPSTPPADCPFEKSKEITGVAFTGRHKEYTRADTWYPSWAADGNLYSPYTDGRVGDVSSRSGYHFGRNGSPVTGYATITGDDPMNLKIINPGVIRHDPFPYGGQYPCGTLAHNGVLYHGTYALDYHKLPWDTMGPFVGFNVSKDHGKTWLPGVPTAKRPLFGESGKNGKPVLMWPDANPNTSEKTLTMGKPGTRVKMVAPHFVDFGKNMEHSPDGKAYLVGHGATRPDSTCSWISGDQIYMARVTPSVENINDVSKYEFFAGHDSAGKPIWVRDFAKIKPLVQWNDRSGCVTMTYNAALNKYLMFVTYGGTSGNGPYDTWIVESDAITGPWRLVSYMKEFGQQAYFVNIPSKFISDDGRTAWLCYAHGWQHKTPDPPGSTYAMNLREFRLLAPGEQAAAIETVPTAAASEKK